ncbi:SDR family oxidoreductase [Frankia sp. Cppng1_Ct_nod]|uniref:SDR family oxidoreductase n=1 Tax=Frankia sp. Cppng1_Ct_nod TaxID=2897162 RepID=UPI0024E0B2D8|nr:SDR family oxidoreductase [Frankia sp. Cppng1_Ct_nod]
MEALAPRSRSADAGGRQARVHQHHAPMGRPWVDPVDVSNALGWLASDAARYVTGIIVPVDQGSQNKA